MLLAEKNKNEKITHIIVEEKDHVKSDLFKMRKEI
jgi:hypothetical protein